MRFARIRAPQDDEVGLLRFAVGAGSATGSEYCRQTDDTGSVSGTVAGVDVIRAEHLPGELLDAVIDLVGGLRAGEEADRVGTLLLDGRPEAVCALDRAPRPR